MKKIQQSLSAVLLSLLFLCFFQKADAQKNQYRMDLKVDLIAVSGKLIVSCANPVTVFNRVDFALSGTGASLATVVGGSSQTFSGTGKKSITITNNSSGLSTTFEFTARWRAVYES